MDAITRLCIGCARSGDEIMRWRDMSDVERRHYMDVVLPARSAREQR